MQNSKQSESFSGSKGVYWSAISTLLFALQFPILKLSFQYNTPLIGAIFESLFTLLFCLLSALITGETVSKISFEPKLFFSGLLNGFGLLALFLAINSLDPTSVSLIGRLYFVFAVLISVYILRESVVSRERKWIILLVGGVFLSAYRDNFGSYITLVGVLAAVVYPLMFALQNALIKTAVSRYSTNSILFQTKTWSLIPLFVYFILSEKGIPKLDSMPGILYVGAATFVSTFLGLRAFYFALRTTTFRLANLIKATEPIFVFLFSFLLFGVNFTAINFLGMGIILTSCFFLVILNKNPRA